MDAAEQDIKFDDEMNARMDSFLNDREEIALPNGYKVSIVWHFNAYARDEMQTVETAIIDPEGNFVGWNNEREPVKQVDDVQPHQNARDVARTLAHALSL